MSPVACLLTLPQLKDFLSLHRPRPHWGGGTGPVSIGEVAQAPSPLGRWHRPGPHWGGGTEVTDQLLIPSLSTTRL